MKRRAKKEYPFKVIVVFPPIGKTKRDTLKHSFFKTEEDAKAEVEYLKNLGFPARYFKR